MHKLQSVRDRTEPSEPCGIPACRYLGVGIWPSTEALNSLSERNALIPSVITATSNSSYLTIEGQSARPFRCQASIWDPPPFFFTSLEIIFASAGIPI
jgi:hypothetical protein